MMSTAMQKLQTALDTGIADQLAAEAAMQISGKKVRALMLQAAVKNPKVAECDTGSVVMAARQILTWGLEPDGIHAAIVPYGSKAQAQPMVQGLVQLAIKSGLVSSIRARIVHENDHFEHAEGLHPRIDHVPTMTSPGNPIAVYAIAEMTNGGQHWEVMTVSDVEAIRKTSRSGNSGPWKDNWAEMAKKNVGRRLCKYLPKQSTSLQEAIEADDAQETIEIQTEPTTQNIVEDRRMKALKAADDNAAKQ